MQDHKQQKSINFASTEPGSPIPTSPGYTNTPENQEANIKSYLMKIIESFKEDMNNSLKKIQKKMGKLVEALKEETQKSLKEIKENTTKKAKELNKAIQKWK